MQITFRVCVLQVFSRVEVRRPIPKWETAIFALRERTSRRQTLTIQTSSAVSSFGRHRVDASVSDYLRRLLAGIVFEQEDSFGIVGRRVRPNEREQLRCNSMGDDAKISGQPGRRARW